jgi:chemotaxis protein CheX
MQVTVEEQDIRDITDAVWLNVLQTPTEPVGTGSALTGLVVAACVQLTGAWTGAVTLQCSPRVARAAAGIMFQSDPAETSVEDVRDALGELVNMVGGNIKALLPGPTQLSLPLVVECARDAMRICDVALARTVELEFLGEAFVVNLYAAGSVDAVS